MCVNIYIIYIYIYLLLIYIVVNFLFPAFNCLLIASHSHLLIWIEQSPGGLLETVQVVPSELGWCRAKGLDWWAMEFLLDLVMLGACSAWMGPEIWPREWFRNRSIFAPFASVEVWKGLSWLSCTGTCWGFEGNMQVSLVPAMAMSNRESFAYSIFIRGSIMKKLEQRTHTHTQT